MLKIQPCESLQKSWLPARKRHRLWKSVVVVAGLSILVYLGVAYVPLPTFWPRYMRHHPALAEISNIMHTVDGISGSPLNVALTGMATDLNRERSAAPDPIIDQYLASVPHQFFKVYGQGNIYSPQNATLTVDQRY
jgi:hypothetical protein